MGTNQNEALHKSLKQFGRSHLSVETAHAIINYVLYCTNFKRKGEKLVPPIWSQYEQPEYKNIDLSVTENNLSCNNLEGAAGFNLSNSKELVATIDHPSDHCYYQFAGISQFMYFKHSLIILSFFYINKINN